LVEDWNYQKMLLRETYLRKLNTFSPKPGGKFRLVTVCIGVNRFMKHTHFKMKTVPTLKDIIEKNEYTITFDLKETGEISRCSGS
jgi:hypothetical protein